MKIIKKSLTKLTVLVLLASLVISCSVLAREMPSSIDNVEEISVGSEGQDGSMSQNATLFQESTAEPRTKTTVNTYYYHHDHLGGTSLVTDKNGEIVQALDYYPYGQTRIDEQSADFDSDNKYTSQKLDPESGLYYYNSRYYNQDIGRFLSLDPMALNQPEGFLGDPQQLNMYGYARNNPLMFNDPDGEALGFLAILGVVLFGVFFDDIAPAQAPAEESQAVSSDNDSKTVGEVISPAWDGMPTWVQLVSLGVLTQGRSIVKSQARKWVRSLTRKVTKTLKNSADDIIRLWGRPETLTRHFDDHGADFGAVDEEDYIRKAGKFFSDSQEKNLPTAVNEEGIIKVYDSETNTFGSYNPDGTIKTFYKPTRGQEYWNDQIKDGFELINE